MLGCWNIKQNKKAILLMEVMITIVILSFGLTLIVRSFMMSLNASHLAKDYMTACLLIEQKMWELQRLGFIEADLDEQGEFLKPHDKFRYRLQTQKTGQSEESEEGIQLNNAKLTISWRQGKKTNNISVETFLRNREE
ncbi:MAG: hypothetical protein ISS47_03835 [Candidatus Omnitrophica bacterium]|nr:hypothetical protein [Candidatus Omnitrophota bacterium]